MRAGTSAGCAPKEIWMSPTGTDTVLRSVTTRPSVWLWWTTTPLPARGARTQHTLLHATRKQQTSIVATPSPQLAVALLIFVLS